MSVWIRTQTKEDLIECNEFMITYNASNPIEYRIRGNDLIIGKYSSKEKALKVMDMIQSFIEALAKVEITSNMIVRDDNNKIINNMIIQMPLDSEV